MDRLNLAQDSHKRRDRVHRIMILRLAHSAGNIATA